MVAANRSQRICLRPRRDPSRRLARTSLGMGVLPRLAVGNLLTNRNHDLRGFGGCLGLAAALDLPCSNCEADLAFGWNHGPPHPGWILSGPCAFSGSVWSAALSARPLDHT